MSRGPSRCSWDNSLIAGTTATFATGSRGFDASLEFQLSTPRAMLKPIVPQTGRWPLPFG